MADAQPATPHLQTKDRLRAGAAAAAAAIAADVSDATNLQTFQAPATVVLFRKYTLTTGTAAESDASAAATVAADPAATSQDKEDLQALLSRLQTRSDADSLAAQVRRRMLRVLDQPCILPHLPY